MCPGMDVMCEFLETGKYVFNEEGVKQMENPQEPAWRVL